MSTPSPEDRAREKAHAFLTINHRTCWRNSPEEPYHHSDFCDRLTARELEHEAEREALQRDLEVRRHPGEVERRLTEALAEASARCEALQRERDEWRTLADRCEDVATLRGERDTALADLATARADLDSATVLYAQVSGELAAARAERDLAQARVLAEARDRIVDGAMDVVRQAVAPVQVRAETAERDLAALRRRVGEAAREDDERTATIRENARHRSPIDAVDFVLAQLDHARAAAGELRGMLREAVQLITTKAVNVATVDVGRLQAFTKCPDVLAVIKETP
jgi:hypothetical protein